MNIQIGLGTHFIIIIHITECLSLLSFHTHLVHTQMLENQKYKLCQFNVYIYISSHTNIKIINYINKTIIIRKFNFENNESNFKITCKYHSNTHTYIHKRERGKDSKNGRKEFYNVGNNEAIDVVK